MAAPYSQDLRDRVLAAYDRGMETQRIAETFAVSKAWARRIKQVRRERGQVSALPMGKVHVIKIDPQRLSELVREKPDSTLEELRSHFPSVRAISAVHKALKRLGLTFKKRQSTQRNKTAPMSSSGVPTGS